MTSITLEPIADRADVAPETAFNLTPPADPMTATRRIVSPVVSRVDRCPTETSALGRIGRAMALHSVLTDAAADARTARTFVLLHDRRPSRSTGLAGTPASAAVASESDHLMQPIAPACRALATPGEGGRRKVRPSGYRSEQRGQFAPRP